MVLFHPFPFDGRIWADNLQALIDAGFRVIAVDYPGFGDSPPPTTPVSIARFAEATADLLEKLAIDRVAVVGLSMGGYAALAFARQAPERLWALVLADTRAAADSPAARQGRADALRAIADKGVDGYLLQSLPKLLAPDAPPAVLSRAVELAEKREETLNAGIAALRDRPDRTEELARIACPTLVLAGEHDQVTPAAEMEKMAAAIRGARFTQLAGVGHLANLEGAGAFNAAVVRFLRESAAAGAPEGR